jgi:hypothetical protein
MALATLVDRLQQYLQGELSPPPALIGGAYPVQDDQLPAVTLSIADAGERLPGIGRAPAPTVTGALRVETTIDLADPVLTFPGGETASLLSQDRRTVHAPHGPLVRADGSSDQPFEPADLRFAIGATVFTPVAGPPGPGEVQVLAEEAQLHVAAPLPATGTLALGYFLGEWEIRSSRYAGALSVEAFGEDAAGVDALSRQLEAALLEAPAGGVPGLGMLSATSWGPVAAGPPAFGTTRRRELRYRFDYELIEPRLGTAGGPILTIDVHSTPGPEQFAVTRQRSPDG